ncbi:protein ILRUN [Ischnura elegans]|uniref:protein ILRUN n=1 Tax=Ischnura elegans TaxID=197161 RepID=UPI001ED8A8E4|nr:protein ILRUN [Ischnura elegans]
MDVDEVEQSLLQQFSCMGTTDKDVLITQLKFIVGNQLNEATAAFFLEMSNWNLQAAVCSYFDFESPNKLPSMAFIKDVTIGEGESVPPCTRFTKTWRLQNSGDESWPPGCCLRFTHGDQLCAPDSVLVNVLEPGHFTDVSVEMVSPQEAGIYQSKWRMSTATGTFFGEIIWVILTVAEGGTLAVTQQLCHLSELGSQPRNEESSINPFGSLARTAVSTSLSPFQESVQQQDGDTNMTC